MPVNDEVLMELEMLKAVAGDEHVGDVKDKDDDAPNNLRSCPSVRILVTRSVEVEPELVLWFGFHDANYPGNGGDECIPLIEVQLEENAPIKYRPEFFTNMAREAAKAEAGQMCINQVYQRVVDGMVEADELEAKKAARGAGGDEEGSKSVVDPTIRLGTQLSLEVFHEWKAKFDAEKLARKAKEAGKKGTTTTAAAAAAASSDKVRLTGRQMWDQSIKNADWKLFEKEAGGDDDDGEDIDFVFDDEEGEEGEEDFDFEELEEGDEWEFEEGEEDEDDQ